MAKTKTLPVHLHASIGYSACGAGTPWSRRRTRRCRTRGEVTCGACKRTRMFKMPATAEARVEILRAAVQFARRRFGVSLERRLPSEAYELFEYVTVDHGGKRFPWPALQSALVDEEKLLAVVRCMVRGDVEQATAQYVAAKRNLEDLERRLVALDAILEGVSHNDHSLDAENYDESRSDRADSDGDSDGDSVAEVSDASN